MGDEVLAFMLAFSSLFFKTLRCSLTQGPSKTLYQSFLKIDLLAILRRFISFFFALRACCTTTVKFMMVSLLNELEQLIDTN